MDCKEITERYTKDLEEKIKQFQIELANKDLMYDLICSKVHIIKTELFDGIKPEHVEEYMIGLGWKVISEIPFKNCIRKVLLSKKKDIKYRIYYYKDKEYNEKNRMLTKRNIKHLIYSLASIHNTGPLKIIYDILKMKV